MSSATAGVVVTHRSQERSASVAFPEQQCSMKLDLSSAWTSYIVALLNFLKDVHARMPTLSCAAERASPGA